MALLNGTQVSTALALAGYVGWTLTLLGVLAVLRSTLTVTGQRAANSFLPDGSDGSPFARRLVRAHANCYENLPIFGCLVLLALATGNSDVFAMLDQLEDSASGVSKIWDREHDAHVTEYLLGQIRGEFSDKTWGAFRRFALDGLSADAVAKELDMSPNAVFIAKSRVMSRLRQHGRGLID